MLKLAAAGAATISGLVVVPLLAAVSWLAGPLPSTTAIADIPANFLSLYQEAVAQRCPTLPWSVLAAVGKIESDHGRVGGGALQPNGRVSPPIIGIPLDGSSGTQEIRDTDGGLFDGDPVHDRAVGPMQFIPSTWALLGIDASGDGLADPHNAIDAIHTGARYFCDAGAGDPAQLRRALWTYNNSWDYVDEVLAWAARYATLTSSGPADPVLIAAVLGSPRLEIYAAGRRDIAAGRIDNRVMATLLLAAEQWTLSVSSLQTGHSKCVGGGSYAGCNVSNHWYGRAFDVHRVNGEPVTAGNADAYAFTVWLSSLEAGLTPDGIGSPWPELRHLPGHFHDAAHLHHIHVGYDT